MDTSLSSKDLGLMKSNMEKEGSSYTNSSNTISSRLQQSLDETTITKLSAKEKTLNCPKCNSNNTKFCYYNNCSLNQPRYFCNTCRRYWTGRSLRDAPIGGGGSRKNKKSTIVSPASTSILVLDMVSCCNTTTATSKISDDGSNHDLNSGFSLVQPSDFTNTSGITTPFIRTGPETQKNIEGFRQIRISEALDHQNTPEYRSIRPEALGGRLGGFTPGPPLPFIPIITNSVPSMSFAMQEFRTNALSWPLNFIRGIGHGENSEGRLLFPFEPRRMDYTDGDVNGNDDRYHRQQNKLPEQNGGDRH